jgi:hypothetical protein
MDCQSEAMEATGIVYQLGEGFRGTARCSVHYDRRLALERGTALRILAKNRSAAKSNVSRRSHARRGQLDPGARAYIRQY